MLAPHGQSSEREKRVCIRVTIASIKLVCQNFNLNYSSSEELAGKCTDSPTTLKPSQECHTQMCFNSLLHGLLLMHIFNDEQCVTALPLFHLNSVHQERSIVKVWSSKPTREVHRASLGCRGQTP